MGDTALAGAEFLLGAALVLATAGVVSVVLYRTARFRPEAMIGVSVSILTLVAIFAAVAGGSEAISTALISLAGVGLGALAGALRSLFDVKDVETRKQEEPPEPDKSSEPEDVQ